MKHETLWFRLAVGALAIVGMAVLVLSLRGRVPHDDVTLPSVPGPAPQTPAR